MVGAGETTRRHTWGAALLLLTVAAARPALGLSNPGDFCSGDPCVISSPKTVSNGAVLDFGTRTVVLQNVLTIGVASPTADGSFTLKCGTFQITGAGQIKGTDADGQAGSATIEAVNNIQINGTTAAGAVRLNGATGGTLSLKTTNGSVSGSGKLDLSNETYSGEAGTLMIDSGGGVSYTGEIDAPGAAQGTGGRLVVNAVGNVLFSGSLDFTGGQGGGGEIVINAGGSVTMGVTDISGASEFGDAGDAQITATGNVLFNGRFRGRGSDDGENCGDGADVDVLSQGDITLAAQMDISGRGLDCFGGSLTLEGARVYLQSDLVMSGTGSEGSGGDLDVTGHQLLRAGGTIELDGGDSGGGDLLFYSDTAVEVTAIIDAAGRTSDSPGSSFVEIDSGGTLTISGTIDASGASSVVEGGGDVDLSGCTINITSTAVIDASGDTGSIAIEGHDKITLRGIYKAAANGGIDIHFGPRVVAPDILGASFSPPPTLTLDPSLLPCRVCNTAADCSDGNACTDDTCQADGQACLHAPRSSGSCDDGNACTTADSCVAGLCVGGPPPSCDDGNVCTADACASATGCVHTPAAGSCNDGNLCTTGDTCQAGVCVGTPLNCNDSNPCTDDACSAGTCSHSFNTAPCSDGSACTAGDRCSGGVCVGGTPVACDDNDGDGVPDGSDPCTTRAWTSPPTKPPDQDPRTFMFSASKLSAADGDQRFLMKGLFNSATAPLAIDPAANGVHIYAEDSGGPFYDVSVPGGSSGCESGDGWTTTGEGFNKVWLYRNRSGALPPGCAPGSANGIASVQITDQRLKSKHGLAFKVKMKSGSVLRAPAYPLTRMQIDLALAAQPSPGIASLQAQYGECAEAVFTGNPIASQGKPSCKAKLHDGALDRASCKGQ
jgi:hypothetical protein